jgi:serine protease Do
MPGGPKEEQPKPDASKPDASKPDASKPDASKAEPPKEEKKPARTGQFTETDPATGREYWAYVPENYDPNVAHALVVWLHPAGDAMDGAVLKLWQDACRKHHIILLGPRAENPTGWLTSEVDFIKADVRKVMEGYTVDRQRVVLHGLGHGAALAFYLAFDARELVRGVATLGGGLQQPPPENQAAERLSVYLLVGGQDPAAPAARDAAGKLREKKFPVLVRDVPTLGTGYLTDPKEVDALAKWIDSLDRL